MLLLIDVRWYKGSTLSEIIDIYKENFPHSKFSFSHIKKNNVAGESLEKNIWNDQGNKVKLKSFRLFFLFKKIQAI